MAYHKDYLLRMMEMMAEMMAIFLGLIKKGNTEQAEKCLNNAYRDFLKQDAAFFHKIPLGEMTMQLLSNHNYTQQHLKVLAELFYAEGELLIKNGDINTAIVVFEKSLYIKKFIEEEEQTFSLPDIERKNQIQKRIKELKASRL